MSSCMFTPKRGVLTSMPASIFVCRLPSPSAVATLILSALMAIEAPVVFFLKSSPVLILSFSAFRAFLRRFTSASSETRLMKLWMLSISAGMSDCISVCRSSMLPRFTKVPKLSDTFSFSSCSASLTISLINLSTDDFWALTLFFRSPLCLSSTFRVSSICFLRCSAETADSRLRLLSA